MNIPISENVMIVSTICGTIMSLGLFVLVGYVVTLLIARRGNNSPTMKSKSSTVINEMVDDIKGY